MPRPGAAVDRPGKARIAIVAHFAYGAFSGGARGHVGGVEFQTTMLARWLTSRGHDVVLITWDEGQEDGARIDGVELRAVCRSDAGLPGVRFVHPRWSSLIGALRRADADVYYHNCAECVTGQVALWCAANGRRFVYAAAHDADCDPALPLLPTRRERVLYRYGIRHADRLIVQTDVQQRMYRDFFQLDSTVIPMPCADLSGDPYVPPAPPDPAAARVAWVGRVVPIKRLEFLFDVAAQLPEVTFDVAGPIDDDDYGRMLTARAATLPNVVLHGRVPREGIGDIYRRACCLACTSESEGFPNTFLEAWSLGRPLISTWGPGTLITDRGLGAMAADVTTFVAELRRLIHDRDHWTACSRRARAYYVDVHRPEAVMPLFEQALVPGHEAA